jgi:hypothetical protein
MGLFAGGIEGFKACLLDMADNDLAILRRNYRDRPLAFTLVGLGRYGLLQRGDIRGKG